MKKFPRRLWCALLVFWLVGCAGGTRPDLMAASAISFTEPGFHLPPGTVLTWRSDPRYLFDDPAERPEDFRPLLQEEVERFLLGRGYTINPEGAEYGVLAVAVLGADLDAEAVLREFRLTPSFPASRRYPRGTLVVAIYSLADEKIRWRGAIQANIDVTEPEATRRERLRAHVARLLNLVPARAL